MPQLADFPRAAQLGFESGKGMASENPLGQFIRGLLANQQQRQQTEGTIGASMGTELFKENLQRTNPLQTAQTAAYESLATERQKSDPKEMAIAAVGTGNPLPGFTMEETKKIAMGSVNMYDLLANMGLGGLGEEQVNNPVNNELVEVVNPKGKRVKIKQSDLAKALENGYKR